MRKPLHSRSVSVRILSLVLMAASLPACSLLIPENPSAPRYNDVLGGPRRPALNPGGDAASAGPRAKADFPPVDPSTEARARDIMASDVPPPAAMAAPMTPVATAQPAPATGGRQVPVENMTVASSNYPDLHTVPSPPPAGTDTRMDAVRQQLEIERNAANGAATRLQGDAAAEPSLIGVPLPEPVRASPNAVPVNTMPVVPTPVPAAEPQPIGVPQSSNNPAPTANGYIALPPPPPPLNAGGSAPTSTAFAIPTANPAPIGNAPMEPITLRAPTGNVASAAPVALNYGAPSQAAPMAPSASGFNPMDGAAPITLRAPTSYASGGNYLPPSRYATRRQ